MTLVIPPHIGSARSSLEVTYLLRFRGCPQCHERDLGSPRYLSYIASGTLEPTGRFDVTCPKCGHQRSVRYRELRESPLAGPGDMGGPDPSQIISPHEFATELARCSRELGARTRADVPLLLQLRAIPFVWSPHLNGQTCAEELAKFLPEGAERIPADRFVTDEARAYLAAHPEQFTRAYIESCVKHYTELGESIRAVAQAYDAEQAAARGGPPPFKPLPLPAFSLAALAFHERWVKDGDGEKSQRMVAVGADARERNLAGRDLTRASLDKVTLARANLRGARLDHAELAACDLTGADLTGASLTGATFTRCDLRDADFTGCSHMRLKLVDCKLAGVRGSLDGAVIVNADYT